MKKVIIFGVTDFSEVVYYYLSNDNRYEIVGFALDKEYITDSTFHNLPIIEFDDIEKKYDPREYSMFIAIGYNKMNKVRSQKYIEAKNKKYELISYVSLKASSYDNVEIGDNCFIFEDNTIQPFSKIGNNTILWSGNHLGHHSKIGDNCFITSHVVIAGRVEVGNNTFIGINATIRDHIKIGKENMIGAGSIILNDTEDYSVFSPGETEKLKVPSNRLRGM